ncbi:MAG: hypothetical protein FWD17_01925, partial [Polyangiaceae bacterium]|nr:hypothetical protein [Polyangiaceae bacterium]
AKKAVSERGLTHPEMFVRARAVTLWHERGRAAENAIADIVQGARTLDNLDLLDQRDLSGTTRDVIASLLAPRWFRTGRVVSHARAFFPDVDESGDVAAFDARALDKSLQEYLAYVLLDFAIVDESLGDPALAHVLQHADKMGVAEAFDRVARDEMKLTKRALDEIRRRAPDLATRGELHDAAEA